jgi:2,3-bisphosphoglycerate-independent phosphoglycerate mutase
MAKEKGVERVFLHAFLDGRDTPPASGAQYVAAVQRQMHEIGAGEIATIVGRYYAMDRDKRWERTQRAYDLLTKAIGLRNTDPLKAIEESYERGVTDEFVEPVAIVREDGAPVATIESGDSVIFFNFRPDRARQLTRALAVSGFSEFQTRIYRTARSCASRFTTRRSICRSPSRRASIATCWRTFGTHSRAQLRLAETEKYAHVTYFFNGGVEKEHECEKTVARSLAEESPPTICTPKCPAFKVTDKVPARHRRRRHRRCLS